MRRRDELSRRTVLAGAALGASLLAGGAGPSAARPTALPREVLGIDAHSHIDLDAAMDDPQRVGRDLAAEMRRSGLAAVCLTFAVDYQPIRRPGEAYERFTKGLAAVGAALAAGAITRSLSWADLRAARAAGRPTVIQAVEGAHFLEGRIERIAQAHERGLRHFGLLHDTDAAPPLGDLYTQPAHLGGLTAFGREAIAACNRLGVLIDLAHASPETVRQALALASAPVIISHTGLDSRQGRDLDLWRRMRPRLINAALAQEVARAGGVIGVWTHLSDTPDAYVDHLRALVDIVGVDHVALGTDTKLSLAPPGEGARQGGWTNQVWAGRETGFFFDVIGAMSRAGFTAPEIGKIGGGNYGRVFAAATRAV